MASSLTLNTAEIPMSLEKRIEAAIDRVKMGHAPMRIPVDQTDIDLVLYDCLYFVREHQKECPVCIEYGPHRIKTTAGDG